MRLVSCFRTFQAHFSQQKLSFQRCFYTCNSHNQAVLVSLNGKIYRVSQKNPKTIENDLLLEFQCLALN